MTDYLQIEDEMRKRIQEFDLFSNTFMSVALEDAGACQHVLRILTGDRELRLCNVKTQYTISKLTSKDACLDVLAEDTRCTLYGLEIQGQDSVDHPRRVRYYGALIDGECLQKGEEHKQLPELYLFYICRRDFLKSKAASERVEKIWADRMEPYDDGAHIVYINAQVDDHTPVAELMKYFRTADPNDMSQGALSKRVHFLKTEEEGQRIMCKVTDGIWKWGYEVGNEEGRAEGKAEGETTMINRYITANRAEGRSAEEITRNLQVYFSLTPNQAVGYMQKA